MFAVSGLEGGLNGRPNGLEGQRSGLDSQPIFEVAHPIPGHAELGFPVVFQPDEHPIDARIQLGHKRQVGNRRSMDSDEAPRIQTLFQLHERVLNRVIAAAGDGKGQLVLREEMGDAPDLEDRRALADARALPATRTRPVASSSRVSRSTASRSSSTM